MPEPAPHSNIGLYRSGVTSPERLRRTSVAREHLLDNAIESLRGSVGRKSKNHLLFIGPRGIGKTHLLSCIEDAVRSDEALSARVVVVRFPEESNRTLSFADFLIGMCGILKEVLEDEPLWTELFAAVQTEEDDAKVADTLVPAIREQNRRHGRTLLVMLENLGEILGRQIRDKNDVAALRKFLMADNGCLLVATAPLHFDGITDVRQPFYDFFDIQILENLSFEETVEVIRLNLEWEERKDILDTLEDMRPRLQALYRMTGGNPRLTMMLYGLIAHESDHRRAGTISPAARPNLAVLSGPAERSATRPARIARMSGEHARPGEDAGRHCRANAHEPAGDLVAAQASHRCPLPARRPTPAGPAFAPVHDSRGILRYLARDESLPRRPQAHAVPARLLQPLLPKYFEAREEKRRQLRTKGFSTRAASTRERALDYLSEVGDEAERSTAKFDMARIYARCVEWPSRRRATCSKQRPWPETASARSIARIVTNALHPLPTISPKSRR